MPPIGLSSDSSEEFAADENQDEKGLHAASVDLGKEDIDLAEGETSWRPSWAMTRNASEINLLDAAMGDFFWMPKCLARIAPTLPAGMKLNYIGVDVSSEAIKLAEARRAKTQASIDSVAPGKIEVKQFQQKDLGDAQALTKDTCGHAPCDIVFCNDALMHNPHAGIQRIVRNFNGLGASFFITNSYRHGSTKDINAGEWRPLDLDKPPYGPEAGMTPLCTEEASVMDGGLHEHMHAYRMPIQ